MIKNSFVNPILTLCVCGMMGCNAKHTAVVTTAIPKIPQVWSTVDNIDDIVGNVLCFDPQQQKIQHASVVPSDSDIHDYVAKPEDMEHLAAASIVFSDGIQEAEPWFMPNKITAENFGLVPNFVGSIVNKEDPHFWQSPALVKQASGLIAQELTKKFPEYATQIQTCLQNYMAAIDTTTQQLKNKLSVIPANKRVMVTSHDAFTYFAKEFGITVVPLEGFSDTAAPSPADFKRVLDKIQAEHLHTIFLEDASPGGYIEKIAVESHVSIGKPLFGDSIGSKTSAAPSILAMWNYNMDALIQSWQ
jgi:zinc/manganese transport system substrate-binding protein